MNKNILLLILAVFTAGFLRFYGLKERGVFDWDEGYYLQYGQFVYSSILNLPSIYRDIKKGESIQEVYDRYVEGTFLSTPKYLTAAAIAAAGIFTGGVRDFTANYINAFAGFFTVLLLGFFMWKAYGTEEALLSVFILGMLPFHVIYSRNSYQEAVPLLCLLAAVYFYQRWQLEGGRDLKAALKVAVPLTVMFGFNYRFIVGVFLIPAAEIYLVAKKKREIKDALKLIGALAVLLVLMSVVFQLPYIVLNHISRLPSSTTDDAGGAIRIMSYWSMLSHWFGGSGVKAVGKTNFGFSSYQLKSLYLFVGLPVIIFYIAGVVRLLRKRSFLELVVFWFSSVPVILFSLRSFCGRLRALAAVLPFMVFIAVLGIKYVLDLCPAKYRKTALFAIIFLIAGASIKNNREILSVKSKMKEACAFVEKNGNAKVFTNNWPLTSFYIGRNNCFFPIPPKVNLLEKSKKENIDFLIVENQYWFELPPYIREKISKSRPIKQFYQPDIFLPFMIRETWLYKKAKELENRPGSRYLCVYEIKDIFPAIKIDE